MFLYCLLYIGSLFTRPIRESAQLFSGPAGPEAVCGVWRVCVSLCLCCIGCVCFTWCFTGPVCALIFSTHDSSSLLVCLLCLSASSSPPPPACLLSSSSRRLSPLLACLLFCPSPCLSSLLVCLLSLPAPSPRPHFSSVMVVSAIRKERRSAAELAQFGHVTHRRCCWLAGSGGSGQGARSALRLVASPPRRGGASSAR